VLQRVASQRNSGRVVYLHLIKGFVEATWCGDGDGDGDDDGASDGDGDDDGHDSDGLSFLLLWTPGIVIELALPVIHCCQGPWLLRSDYHR